MILRYTSVSRCSVKIEELAAAILDLRQLGT